MPAGKPPVAHVDGLELVVPANSDFIVACDVFPTQHLFLLLYLDFLPCLHLYENDGSPTPPPAEPRRTSPAIAQGRCLAARGIARGATVGTSAARGRRGLHPAGHGLKPVFVEEAHRTLRGAATRTPTRHPSLLSGVHRWTSGNGAKQACPHSRRMSCRSATGYSRDGCGTHLPGSQATPKTRRLGPTPSFESLARSVTVDLRPFNVLAELLRLRAGADRARRAWRSGGAEPGRLRAAARLEQSCSSCSAEISPDHAATAVANLLGEGPRLEQAVFADGIRAESARQLQELGRKLWAQARREMIGAAQQLYEADRGHPEAVFRMRRHAFLGSGRRQRRRFDTDGDHEHDNP